jgi:hypothetical protein
LDTQGGGTGGAGLDAGAHQGQGLGDPPHGAPAQGGVPHQGDRESLPRQQPAQQAHGSARVAQIQGVRRRLEATQTQAIDEEISALRSLNPHPHGAKSRQGGEAVLAFQKAADPGLALGQGPEHDGAMGDGLVPRHPQTPAQRPAGGHQKAGSHTAAHAPYAFKRLPWIRNRED